MYLRQVALGDSQTEGLNDGDELTRYRGWADRLAEAVAGDLETMFAALVGAGARVGTVAPLSRAQVVRGELAWGRAFVLPWLGRRLLRRSSGDGRVAKRPTLTPVLSG